MKYYYFNDFLKEETNSLVSQGIFSEYKLSTIFDNTLDYFLEEISMYVIDKPVIYQQWSDNSDPIEYSLEGNALDLIGPFGEWNDFLDLVVEINNHKITKIHYYSQTKGNNKFIELKYITDKQYDKLVNLGNIKKSELIKKLWNCQNQQEMSSKM